MERAKLQIISTRVFHGLARTSDARTLYAVDTMGRREWVAKMILPKMDDAHRRSEAGYWREEAIRSLLKSNDDKRLTIGAVEDIAKEWASADQRCMV